MRRERVGEDERVEDGRMEGAEGKRKKVGREFNTVLEAGRG